MNGLKQSYFIIERHLPGRFTDGSFRPHDPYCCMWCRVEFETAEELREHSKVAHYGAYSDRACFMCSSQFTTTHRQMRHVDLVHKKLRPYRCLRCGKCYYASHDLLRHVQREHEHVQYKCGQCDAIYRGDCELRGHYMKTHRCRIKFKGILGPEIELVIPLSKNSRDQDAPSAKERIKSARIMERIKMKYDAPPAIVVKQERIVWNDGERRVAKKSTGGKKSNGNGEDARGEASSSSSSSPPTREKPLSANRVNILPSLATRSLSSSSSSFGNFAKKSTTKPPAGKIVSRRGPSLDENSPRSVSTSGKTKMPLAKKSTCKSSLSSKDKKKSSSSSSSPPEATADSTPAEDQTLHGTRVRISMNGAGGMEEPSLSTNKSSNGLVVQPVVNSSVDSTSGEITKRVPGCGEGNVNEASVCRRPIKTNGPSSSTGKRSKATGPKAKKARRKKTKSTVTFANAEYTLMTPNIILDADSPPPPPMKTEPGEEIERKLTLYGCLYCQRKCANVELVVAHLFEKHGIVMDADQPVSYHWNLSFLCTICDEAFDEESKIEEHLLTHNNDMSFCYDAGGGGGGYGGGADSGPINYDDMSDCILLD